jgi:hypothetical protein
MFPLGGVYELIELAERCADGLVPSRKVRERVAQLANPDFFPVDQFDVVWPYRTLGWNDPYYAALAVSPMPRQESTYRPLCAELLRCIVGNPFPRGTSGRRRWFPGVISGLVKLASGSPYRPAPEPVNALPTVAIDPAWITSTVVSLTQTIYDQRAFDRLPILADALEEAGCDDADLLFHCRSEGPHVRGCWVVDLVLGKQ